MKEERRETWLPPRHECGCRCSCEVLAYEKAKCKWCQIGAHNKRVATSDDVASY